MMLIKLGSDGKPEIPRHRIVEIASIDARMASAILAHCNSRNRPISRISVAFLASEIAGGRFRDSGQGIGFDRNGVLVDGQHRLKAVEETGIPIVTTINYGLDPEVFASIDTHKQRRASDVLGIEGFHNLNTLAATAKMALSFEKFGDPNHPSSRAWRCSSELIANWVRENPRVTTSIEAAKGSWYQSATAWVHFMVEPIDAEMARRLIDDVIVGAMLQHDDPVKMIRDRMQQANRNTPKSYYTVFLVKAWNSRRTGKRIARMTYYDYKGERFPQIDGLIYSE